MHKVEGRLIIDRDIVIDQLENVDFASFAGLFPKSLI